MNAPAQHGTASGDATIAIQKLARSTGSNVQELQTLYVLEALLSRVAHSAYREDFILKGGVLLSAFALRRPTRDIDLQAASLANDISTVAARIGEIAGISVPDGVTFDQASIVASVIREGDQYSAVRVKLVGILGTSRLTVGIDVNFGDPISPDPQIVDLPQLIDIGQPRVAILGYPLTMVLAEKVTTAIDRGVANTRWRDFADVYGLIRSHQVRGDELATSLAVVAAYRGICLRPLLPALAEMPGTAQTKWAAWRSRTSRQNDLPLLFSEVLEAVAGFADPIIYGGAGTWSPRESSWGGA